MGSAAHDWAVLSEWNRFDLIRIVGGQRLELVIQFALGEVRRSRSGR
jgi:hypothetical protein